MSNLINKISDWWNAPWPNNQARLDREARLEELRQEREKTITFYVEQRVELMNWAASYKRIASSDITAGVRMAAASSLACYRDCIVSAEALMKMQIAEIERIDSEIRSL